MNKARFIVGIDLGTTHCVVSESRADLPAVQLLEVTQLVAEGEVALRPLLPSFLYLPAAGELAPGDTALPWGPSPHIVGELARRLGAKVPARLVASAKSWICHGGVNRRAQILPWSAPDSEPHISPFEAQVAYLRHLRAAWDSAHAGVTLADQEVIVTVPASFDEAARELTVQAAEQAGLQHVRLIEEPQAAFYDFLGQHGSDDALAATFGDAKLILVVDVGGGTTDLTLLKVLPNETPGCKRPELERIAVGGHLMLGGDNMDAALAHHIQQKAGITKRLDPTEWSALTQSACRAKERLLGDDAPDEVTVTVQQRGARLVGGTRSVTLTRDEISDVLLEGFLPMSAPTDAASREARAGLTTLGLPYTSDPAITRHICAFLRQHAQAAALAGARVDDGLPRPDLLLLNGGVFNAKAMVARLSDVLAHWYGGEPVRLLKHTSLDAAVACGATRYGLARHGQGQVITGGTARAYYVGVEDKEGAPQAICVAPRGMDEGSTVDVPNRIFEVVIDRRVAFPLFSYTGDRVDVAGDPVSVDEQLDPLPPLVTVLREKSGALKKSGSGGVPVTLSAALTESGALELYLVTVELPPRRWRLQFALRDDANDDAPPEGDEHVSKKDAIDEKGAKPQALPPGYGEARQAILAVFGGDGGRADPKKAQGLRRKLETALGPRGQWPAQVCRGLCDALLSVRRGRGRNAVFELTWLRLVGWCLRPGIGASGDGARIEAAWTLHGEGLQHPSKANWAEWWVMWRRMAAGLDRAQQQTLCESVRPWLTKDGKPGPGPRAHGHAEMLQLVATLERLSAETKTEAGSWFLARADKACSWWPLGRLGTREPIHGDPSEVVRSDVAERWLEQLLDLDWSQAVGAPFAALLLARTTGDPRRDIDAAMRQKVKKRLTESNAPVSWLEMLSQPTSLLGGDSARVYGDALPSGLRLR